MKGKCDVKKLWKRNQIMITALALMLAIAGYLNFTGKQIDDEVLFTTSAQFEEADAGMVEENEVQLTSSDSTIIESEVLQDEISLYDISEEDAQYYTEIQSMDEEINVTAEATTEEIPGEAVFTNTVSITSLEEANLMKEQTRSQNKQALLDIINNASVTETAKQEAVNSMIQLTDVAQKECDTLVMLQAKGFPDAVVSINGESVDVCIGMSELTQPQIAQIESIVKRKTGVAAENIIISPVGQ